MSSSHCQTSVYKKPGWEAGTLINLNENTAAQTLGSMLKGSALAEPRSSEEWDEEEEEGTGALELVYYLESSSTTPAASDGPPNAFVLDGNRHYSLGRLPTSDIPLEHSSISKIHAILLSVDTVEDCGEGTTTECNGLSGVAPPLAACVLMIMDLGSAQGTFLNGQRLPPCEPRPLQVGDRIHLGQCPRAFCLSRRAVHKRTASAGGAASSSSSSVTTESEVTAEKEEEVGSQSEDHWNQDGYDDASRLLCMDVGTSGVRAYIYSAEAARSRKGAAAKGAGRFKSRDTPGQPSCQNRGGCFRALPTLYPKPGWVEQDPIV